VTPLEYLPCLGPASVAYSDALCWGNVFTLGRQAVQSQVQAVGATTCALTLEVPDLDPIVQANLTGLAVYARLGAAASQTGQQLTVEPDDGDPVTLDAYEDAVAAFPAVVRLRESGHQPTTLILRGVDPGLSLYSVIFATSDLGPTRREVTTTTVPPTTFSPDAVDVSFLRALSTLGTLEARVDVAACRSVEAPSGRGIELPCAPAALRVRWRTDVPQALTLALIATRLTSTSAPLTLSLGLQPMQTLAPVPAVNAQVQYTLRGRVPLKAGWTEMRLDLTDGRGWGLEGLVVLNASTAPEALNTTTAAPPYTLPVRPAMPAASATAVASSPAVWLGLLVMLVLG